MYLNQPNWTKINFHRDKVTFYEGKNSTRRLIQVLDHFSPNRDKYLACGISD